MPPSPSQAQTLVDRGIAAEEAGNAQQARRHYTEAIDADPGHAPAYCNRGLLDLLRGEYALAESDFRAALRLKEIFPEAWVGLAEALEATGRGAEALAALERAIALRPGYMHALLALVDLLQAQGRRGETVPLLFEALAARPADSGLRRSLAYALAGATLGNTGAREHALLASLCTDESVSTALLAPAIAGILKSDPAFPALQAAVRTDADPFMTAAAYFGSPLLLAALPRTSFTDPGLEVVLTYVRRCILSGANAPQEFACALARHCFHSGYAFAEGKDERRQVSDTRAAVEAELSKPAPDVRILEPLLLKVALYDSLHTLTDANRLPALEWTGPFAPIVREQILNRIREGEIAARIPTLTPIDDATSEAVRNQYEESPYPLWVSVPDPGAQTIESLTAHLRPGREVRTRPRPVPILVAGCGTGHHPIQLARAQPDSAILAVDLSKTSLAYAARMAGHLGISNIAFAQADILGLGTLDRRFPIIESAGVLHHLKDPLEGWRVLTSLLEDDGLMKIALYSERARRGIHAARALLEPMNLPRTAEGIRRCRRFIMDLPDGDPAREALGFGDFYNLNGCRDLLMHVQEHMFTLPKIAEYLHRLGLKLLEIDCDAQTRERFGRMFPEPGAKTDPGAWDRFEAVYPDTFKGMIVFWCGRSD